MRKVLTIFLIPFIITINSGKAHADDLLSGIESLMRMLSPGEQEDSVDKQYAPKKTARGIGRLDQIIRHASARFGVDEDLIRAIIGAESGWNPMAVSSKGARGLMQLMPDTARLIGVRRIFDPYENILAGTYYYRQLYDTFKNHRAALCAYNCGCRRVMEGRIPQESRIYAERVLQLYKNLKYGRA